MQFGASHMLLLLLPLGALWLLIFWRSSRRQGSFASLLSPELAPLLSTRKLRISQTTRLHLQLLAVALLLLALARPQWGYEWKDRSRSGVDLVVVVDVSQSMLATDVPPTRLEQARREVMDLLRHLQGDRVGLVSFSAVAFTEVPLTLDYSAFELILNSLSPQLIPIGGTNIQAALLEAARVFGSSSGPERAKAVVLITDGEEFDGNAAEAMRALEEKGVRVYVLGIGTPEGAPIPTPSGHKRAKDGSLVLSRLRPDVLRSLAQGSGGRYVQAVVTEADTHELYVNGIKQQLDAKTIEWGSAKQWNEYYQLPLSLSLLTLLIAWFPPSRRLEASQRRIAFASATMSGLLFLILSPDAAAANPERLGEEAKQALIDGRFEEAYDAFSRAHTLKPTDTRFLVGIAASLYRQQRFEEALQTYLMAADQSENPLDRAKQHYNAGNALVQLGRYQEAISQYELSLALHPEDKETQQNLAYAKKLLQQQQQDQQKEQQEEGTKQQQSQEQQQQSKQQQSQQDQQSDEGEKSEEQKDGSEAEQSGEQGQNSKEAKSAESAADQGQRQEKESQSNTEQGHKDDEAEESQEQSKTPNARPEEPEEAKKEQPDAQGPQDAEAPKPEGSPTPSEAASAEGAEQEGSSEKAGRAARLSSEDLMQLRSVQEQRGAQIRFRAKKAVEQLKELELKMPEKDW